MVLSALPRPDLFLGILFPDIPDQRSHRPGWFTSRARIPRSRGALFQRPATFLVCSVASVVPQRRPRARNPLLDRHACFSPAHREPLAARHARNLLCSLRLLRKRRARFFRLSIGRHASRSRLNQHVLRAAGILAGPWPHSRAITRKPVPVALGVVPDLFRIRRRQNRERRSILASSHRHG